MFEEYLNQKVLISVKPQERVLIYTAVVKEISNTHISFVDKFSDSFTFRIEDIVEIKLANNGDING